jgi:thioredoxin-related protein
VRTVLQTALILVALGAGMALGVMLLGPDSLAPSQKGPPPERILYFFTTNNCIYCGQMKKVMKEPAVKGALTRYYVQEVHGDEKQAEKFGVDRYPTFVITDLRGNVLGKQVGATSAHGFTAWLSRDGR